MADIKHFVFLFSAFIAASSQAAANDNASEKIEYKLTTSYYDTNSNDAYDLNLRANTGNHTAWLGQYQDESGFRQTRTGYEYKQDENIARIVWSAQIASRGFLGGSITAEVGGNTFAIVGIGRTNLHDYYNLNFDPNDALTAGIGSRALENTELSFFRVWDDRLDTHQQVTHCVVRYTPASEQRITLDASHKSGFGQDGIYLEGYGVSVTYDFQNYFSRIAVDQHANFARENMFRLSVGMRF